MKRTLSFILALVMLIGLMPMQALASGNAETVSGTNELAGKTISILGASISTYTGISNNTAYNSTIGNNAVYYTEGRHGVYTNDTWWIQVANDLGLRLLVNNSWSGSSLLYERNGTVGAYVDRCVQLHNNEGEMPDIIAIQMGTNDFQYYKDTLGTADIDYAELIVLNEDGSYTYAEPTTSLEAAAIVLHKISIRYPDAEVYYLNISQRIDGTDELIRSFNADLKQVVEHFGAHIVDIYGSTITMADFDTYIGDGRVHPNCLGMDAYTEAFKRAILANTAYNVDSHTASLNLDGVTADYGDDKIVVSGDAFSCTLTAEDGKELSVSVTMGGEDITDTAYENGTVSIESVTADVVITAEATVHESQNYRWEFDGTDLACVSGGNTLAKDAGTTTDGVFSKTRYALENEVVLLHDRPWIVEWKCEGTFLNTNGSSGARIFTSDNVNANYNARYIFKSNTNGIIAMGEKDTKGSHNYGVALADHGIDWTELHTYRLENRIAADGSNMIYLFVDGKEIGPMNHYYIGTKDQVTTSDWLSGKDFVFPYMGTDTHGFTNASIDYIQVWEGGHSHTYENGICTGCGATVSPYLQRLPEIIVGCTNLYDSLVPVKGYYTATKYDTSNGDVLSVVIPVEPGDRIAASSFGSVAENMGSVNGIRVTYLLGDKIVTSLSAGDVYNGYTKNGYITVPDGVDAVCVPWWKPSDSNWLTLSQISKDFAVHIPKTVSAQAPTCTESGYTAGEICEICGVSLGEREEIPATGHSYSGDTCAVCGTVNLLAFLDGKYVSILGDSISTFNGYSNDAAVNTTIGGNGPRYDEGTADTKPGSYCLLESVNDTWWMHFANRSGMKLLVNNSWAGSQVFGGKTSDGRVIPAAYLDRCVNLHDNTLENNSGNAPINPDVIFVYLGINDYNFNRGNVGTDVVDYAGLVNSDGTYVTPATFGEAYGIMLHKMRNAYPDAQIFAMTLLPENLYSVDKTAWEQHNVYIRAAAEYYDIALVDLAENCAITWENYSGYMIDKIHPTTAGMELISDCIEAELVAYYKGNRPHTHTYEPSVTAPTCTEQGYTTYTCECGDSYVDAYVDATGHAYENGICTGCGDTLAGKTVSILGDSISTYTGVSNSTTYNSTIGSNKVYYSAGTLGVYQEDTWWQQMLDVLGMELCVNNSWSGSAIFGTRAGTVGAYVDRCVQLHNDQTGEEPDVILVFMGTNDFSYTYDGGELGNYDLGLSHEIDYAALIQKNEDGSYTYADPTTSTEAYAIMLHKMQQRYPDAEIYCMSLMTRRYPVYSKADVGQPTEFNAKLKEVVDTLGVNYIELEGLFASDPADFDLYMGDKRVHPNKVGMDLMTEAVVSALMGERAEICTVSYSLNGIESNNTTATVLVGGRYNAILSATDSNSNISVTVTMDGKDVTASCYKNREISISNVTGDIVITASVIKEPANYRWELIDGTFVSNGDNENVLTLLAGSVSDGVQNSAQYALAENVVLMHDQPWVVEWKSSGDWSGMLLTSTTQSATSGMEFIFRTYNTTGLFALGYYTGSQYNNYGIPLAELDLDMSQSHTYRMENRIAEDNSNMVYLLIDGVEIGALDNYYIGGTKDQNATVDWVNGQDFTFGYIGSTSHPLKNMELQYLQVWESGIQQPGPIITKQPTNGEAKLGERYMVEVKAEGEGLTYQWYFRNAGTAQWYKSSVTDNTYDDVMTTARAGREVYCVVTDANGNTITTDIAKLICLPSEELVIVTQPSNAEAMLGESFCVTVEARGEGLKYQWYYRNAGSNTWNKSGVRDNTYDDVMTTARAGREVYCVITDAYGNSVTTNTVKLIRTIEELEIITQPTNGEAVLGENYCVTVVAKGEGLKYQWYFRNAGSAIWYKSSVTDNTYDDVMTTARAGREIYCVITDKYGNSVTTDIVKLIRVPARLEIITQPTDAAAAFDEMFCATVEAKGEGLKYQWYYRNAGTNTWHKSGVRDNTYDDIMTKARNGREVYCVITDQYGNSVTTDIVKLIAVPKVELQLLSVSYESAAMGGRYCVTVEAQGDGLTYQWYFRNAGSNAWYKSSVTDNTYDDVMTKARANREVYCVITDIWGNSVTTETVTLICSEEPQATGVC